MIHPFDGGGLLGIARESKENEGRQGKRDGDPQGPKCRRSGVEKDEFPKRTVNTADGEGDFGRHEEAGKTVERERQVDEDDLQARNHKTSDSVALGNTVTYTRRPKFIESRFRRSHQIAKEADSMVSDIQDKGILHTGITSRHEVKERISDWGNKARPGALDGASAAIDALNVVVRVFTDKFQSRQLRNLQYICTVGRPIPRKVD